MPVHCPSGPRKAHTLFAIFCTSPTTHNPPPPPKPVPFVRQSLSNFLRCQQQGQTKTAIRRKGKANRPINNVLLPKRHRFRYNGPLVIVLSDFMKRGKDLDYTTERHVFLSFIQCVCVCRGLGFFKIHSSHANVQYFCCSSTRPDTQMRYSRVFLGAKAVAR